MRIALISVLALTGWACSEDLDVGGPEPAPAPAAGVVDHGDGTWSLVVDATDDTAWTYVDLADGRLVAASGGWDLAFQRFHIGVNGGAGGDGLGAALWLADGTLAVDAAPTTGWVQDAAAGDDVPIEHAFGEWYAYDAATHQLSPKAGIWFVRAADAAAHYAVRIDSYYDAVGTAAMIRITWRVVADPSVVEAPEPQPEPDPTAEPPVEVPLPDDAVAVPSNGMAPTFLALGDGVEVVEPGEPWDIGFLGVHVLTNGGSSGDGWAAARATDLAYDALTEAPTVGYVGDTLVPLPGPPGSGEMSGSPLLNDPAEGWYDYDPSTHTVTPKPRAWLLRTHDGRYARFEILAYGRTGHDVRGSIIDAAPEVHQTELAGTDEWTYFNLRSGLSVVVEDPATETHWDLGVFGVRIRTNGGTSGAGRGGAYRADAADAGDADRCAPDALLPEPGPPGSGEFSGSPTLGAWYDYDGRTHTVTPMDADWVVCAADGSLAQVRILDYADGALQLEWRYAGPGREAF